MENNVDPLAKRDAADHLELLLTNQGDTPLAPFSAYYTIKDLDSGITEAYLLELAGFELPAKGQARIHFDDTGQAGHFRANAESRYVRSESATRVTVSIQAGDQGSVTVEIAKDAGGAEEAD